MKQILIAIFILLNASFAAAAVDINSASAEELAAELDGVGVKKAMAIVAYRSEHGKFKSVDELSMVKGIGAKILEKNRTLILLEKDQKQ